ncbi:hypothetical protein [Leminorella grimontii]|uniref:polyurethane esterase n=1 Tax=Leminorella grimontii TaxID=82981 RepID=UPI00321FB33D
MAIFDIKGYDSDTSIDLIRQSLIINNYTFRNLYEGLQEGYSQYGMTPSGIIPMIWTGVFGSRDSQGLLTWSGKPGAETRSYQAVQEVGWKRISADDLHYSGKEDKWSAFVGEHPLFRAAQADVLGQWDADGNLTRITVGFRGVTGERENLIADTVMDIVNIYNTILKDNPDYIPKAFGQLLDAVAQFAKENGLEGKDVTFTGHSMGGSLVSNMASLSASGWGGFFKDSLYLASASSRINDDDKNVFNMGLENDPVYRATDGGSLMLFDSLFVHDKEYATAMDNVVSFHDLYAGKAGLLNLLPYSIANFAHWVAHMSFSYEGMFNAIVKSRFYDLTEQDSVIVVSALSNATRGNTWVEDLAAASSSHYGQSAFILGSEYNDLLKGGASGDRLEGFSGNDRIQPGAGNNIVDGGEGHDEVMLFSSLASYSVSRDSEGTVYLYDEELGTMNTLYNVELLTDMTSGDSWKVTGNGLLSQEKGAKFNYYANTAKGTEQDDVLTLSEKGWMFGGDGNDRLTGSSEGTLFYGGKGDDEIFSHGRDRFIFNEGDGNDVIHGFSGGDLIQLVGLKSVKNVDSLFDNVTSDERGVTLRYGEGSSLLLVNVQSDMLMPEQFVFV